MAKDIINPHANCVVCSTANAHGMGVKFLTQADGSVKANFDCSEIYQGYSNVLHGGIISALLDGAMANCMLSKGIHAVTAELNIKFIYSVRCNEPVEIEAWLTRNTSRLYLLESKITQADEIMATAKAKFMAIIEPPVEGN